MVHIKYIYFHIKYIYYILGFRVSGLPQGSATPRMRNPRGLVWSCGLGVENDYFTEMCSGSEAGSYLRLIDLY